jgi:hypothetical protein
MDNRELSQNRPSTSGKKALMVLRVKEVISKNEPIEPEKLSAILQVSEPFLSKLRSEEYIEALLKAGIVKMIKEGERITLCLTK